MNVKSSDIYLVSINDEPYTVTPGISLFEEDEVAKDDRKSWGFLSYYSLFEERMVSIDVSFSPVVSKDQRTIEVKRHNSLQSYRVQYLSKEIFDSCAESFFKKDAPDLKDDDAVQEYFKNYSG